MNARETAVVLIEFQNEFCHPDGKLHGLVKAELARQNTVPNAVKVAAAARAKGCTLIFVPFVYDGDWVLQNCMGGLIANAGAAGAFQKGSWGGEFISELQPKAGDLVLKNKRALSGFAHTELDGLLRERKIRNVALGGFLSNVCVEATARSAYDRGYSVTVLRDATCAASKENQDYVEREIYPILGGAQTVDEFIAGLK